MYVFTVLLMDLYVFLIAESHEAACFCRHRIFAGAIEFGFRCEENGVKTTLILLRLIA